MKSILTIICLLGSFIACQGQNKSDASKITTKKDTTKQMNLLDEQTKLLGQAFTLGGLSDEENPTGGADNYLDMINKMEGSAELKAQVTEIYDLYDTSLDPTKKEELKLKINVMMEKAIKKTQSEAKQ